VIYKGKVTSIEDPEDRNNDYTRACVMPSAGDGVVTRPLTIPQYLRGQSVSLAPDAEVVYVVFDDGSGVILTQL